MKTCDEWIKEYRSGVNPITGEPNLFKDLSDQMIWDAAQEEIKKSLSSDAVLCAVPIVAGNSYGIQFLCSACDFPKDETLTMDMKHCWNCGVKLDWSKCEY